MSSEKELNELSARIDDLVQRIEFIGDPAVRANVVTLVQSLMDLHQRGFARIVELLQADENGSRLLPSLASDELVGGLMVLYGLHPDGLESRVKKAVAKVSAELTSAKTSIELLAVDEGIVRVQLTTASHGCSSHSPDIEKLVRDAVYSEAPDVERVDIEKVAGKNGADALVQLQVSTPAMSTQTAI
ncbi:MAG TPA: NifU family protein [Candidatus Acidoferrales bacterium]|nr:NifU family protein [Candidatus Acidoferrales bacterium]